MCSLNEGIAKPQHRKNMVKYWSRADQESAEQYAHAVTYIHRGTWEKVDEADWNIPGNGFNTRNLVLMAIEGVLDVDKIAGQMAKVTDPRSRYEIIRTLHLSLRSSPSGVAFISQTPQEQELYRYKFLLYLHALAKFDIAFLKDEENVMAPFLIWYSHSMNPNDSPDMSVKINEMMSDVLVKLINQELMTPQDLMNHAARNEDTRKLLSSSEPTFPSQLLELWQLCLDKLDPSAITFIPTDKACQALITALVNIDKGMGEHAAAKLIIAINNKYPHQPSAKLFAPVSLKDYLPEMSQDKVSALKAKVSELLDEANSTKINKALDESLNKKANPKEVELQPMNRRQSASPPSTP